ncbi:MAG: protein phosphatase 2C domain-containing protein [Chitinophagaceae bacterium]
MVPPAGKYYCNTYSFSEKGPVRDNNEDYLLIDYPEKHTATVFAILADGMGGHNAGEVASNIACIAARNYIAEHYNQHNVPAMLEAMMQHVQSTILYTATRQTAYEGMGTTATALFIRHNTAYYAHIGDSRLYLLRNHKLLQCTNDDSLVSKMVKEGLLTEKEAADHYLKNVLTQALGSETPVTPQISAAIPLQPADRFLLCSDGAYNILNKKDLNILLQLKQPEKALEKIRMLCIEREAEDNFSCVLVVINNQ